MPMSINYNNQRSKPGGRPYAMTHNWDLSIGAVPTPLQSMKELMSKEGAINANCMSISNLPNSNLGEGIISGNIRGVPFHQAAGRESSVREMNFVLYEISDYSLFKFFECWKSMAVNRFDWSQNLDAMVAQGIQVVMTDSERRNALLVYDLFDVVCTKCSLSEQMTSEPDFVKTNVSLKCGYYNISKAEDTVKGVIADSPTTEVF